MKKLKKIPKWLEWPWWVTALLLFAMFFAVSWGRLDPDFGWHLKSGAYFLTNGIPATDIFTYTFSSFPWANHEWLSDILLYLLHSWGGYGLLVLVYALIWTSAFVLVGRGKLGPVVLIAAVATLPFAGVRAVAWDILFLSLTMFIFELKNPRWRWLMAPLICLWANMHGGFLIGLFYILYKGWRERTWGGAATLFVVCALVTLVNPYGLHLYNEILLILFDSNKSKNIAEWRALWLNESMLAICALWGAMIIMNIKKHRWTEYIRMDVLMLLASLKSIRHWPLFALTAIEPTDKALRKAVLSMPQKLGRKAKIVLAIVGAFAAVPALYAIYSNINLWESREAKYPTAAVKYLSNNPCQGQLFNEYNFGGYLIWQLPSHKVYIDGRGPIWVIDGENLFDIWKEVFSDDEFRKAQFERYDITCALVSADREELINHLKTDGWSDTKATDSSHSVLLVKQ